MPKINKKCRIGEEATAADHAHSIVTDVPPAPPTVDGTTETTTEGDAALRGIETETTIDVAIDHLGVVPRKRIAVG